MKRLLALAALFCALVAPANAWRTGTATYLGQVTTRAWVPQNFLASSKWIMAASGHILRSSVTSIQIVDTCWYIGVTETAAGADCTIIRSVENPRGSGNFTQVTYKGLTTGVIPNGTSLVSDPISITAAAGVTIGTRALINNTAGVVVTGGNGITNFATFGDVANCSATPLSDQTMGGVITAACSGNSYMPIAIIANTTAPAICILGDSIARGTNDTVDASGDVGSVARSIGPTLAYINISVGGTKISDFNSSHAQRLNIINPYCTHVIVELGINDIGNGASAATTESRLTTLYALIVSKRIYQTTLIPATTSSGTCSGSPPNVGTGWATSGDQSIPVTYNPRPTVNDWIRANTASIAGFFEVADVLETARNSGLWVTTGVGCVNTGDGIHGLTTGYKLIPTANAIPVATFTWPYQ